MFEIIKCKIFYSLQMMTLKIFSNKAFIKTAISYNDSIFQVKGTNYFIYFLLCKWG